MKKFTRIFFITLLSLCSVLIVTISIVLWLVFTPERITLIVRKQAEKFISCQTEIGKVELTFFSTFPNFGIRVSNFALINPVAEAACDTLVRAEEIVAAIDAVAWLKRKELVLIGLEMTKGSVYVFSDTLGNTNYDIFASDSTSVPSTETESEIPSIDIRNIGLSDINLSYNDLSSNLKAVINDLSATISGTITGDSVSGLVKISRSDISVEYKGEKYLKQAAIQLDLPVDLIMSRQLVRFKTAMFSINNLELFINGTVENDTINKNIITDIRYKFVSWPVKNILALVPDSYRSYLEGIDADGLLSSNGSIKGLYNDSVIPLADINLSVEKGALKYAGFPLSMHDIDCDITLYSDFNTDSITFMRINRFSAKTPQSAVETEGLVTHLFSDIFCDLTTSARLKLDEFDQMVPDSMNIKLKGQVSGKVKSAFSMTQLEKMQIEKMKLSGSLLLSDFDVYYDSLSVKTSRSKIDFSIPNRKASAKNTTFAYASIYAENLLAGKQESFNASMKNASMTLETSDARDTTRIPDLIFSFKMDSLYAEMDTISISLAKPNGKVSVNPRPDQPDQPRIKLLYKSDELKTFIGNNSAIVKKINIDTDILNDNTQKDIFLQWLVRGFIDLNQGQITMSGFSYPIDIPSIKMNFDPEKFSIKESILQIGKSDFRLTGDLNNVLSYFRGDSILRGNFSFVSNTTDISQLMALTNGIGNEDTTVVEKTENPDIDTTYTGPYMVPKGVDILLSTNVGTATMGTEIATNIIGNVLVKDGILLLDGLTFETPAARMQLTAMYRTPRKNHLFLGLDYHMLDVEIGELLTMIPDIDTLMPMLRSFGGKGEFHIAVETYLDSMYNVKKSTLRGASSIKGNNLVLMDGETFSEIAKKLNFNKKTENKVDSLAAEFTIFRNEIDIYPFLIVMDKYKAVIAGRHNFDMSFDYHISVVDCPLPIKLGIDIKGNMDDLSYSLARARYAEYYRPTSRRSVESKQLELRKMIRDMLTEKVKE